MNKIDKIFNKKKQGSRIWQIHLVFIKREEQKQIGSPVAEGPPVITF